MLCDRHIRGSFALNLKSFAHTNYISAYRLLQSILIITLFQYTHVPISKYFIVAGNTVHENM